MMRYTEYRSTGMREYRRGSRTPSIGLGDGSTDSRMGGSTDSRVHEVVISPRKTSSPFPTATYAKWARSEPFRTGQNWAESGRIGQSWAELGRVGQSWAERFSFVQAGSGRYTASAGAISRRRPGRWRRRRSVFSACRARACVGRPGARRGGAGTRAPGRSS